MKFLIVVLALFLTECNYMNYDEVNKIGNANIEGIYQRCDNGNIIEFTSDLYVDYNLDIEGSYYIQDNKIIFDYQSNKLFESGYFSFNKNELLISNIKLIKIE